jgi:preprotein translocase subunit SecA
MAWWNKFIPSKNDREIARMRPVVEEVNGFEGRMKALPDGQLRAKTDEFRRRFRDRYQELGGNPDARVDPNDMDADARKSERKRVNAALAALLPEAFAVVREAARRTLGMRHYDVQLMGGMALHHGSIAEMKTGEGKTLAATLPVYLNALAGRGVHVVTVNEYLAQRDAQWMGNVYQYLGMQVGAIVHGLSDEQRQRIYNGDIAYGTNSEFGFDYLRDNMKLFMRDYAQRPLHYAIVDEVDSILIDEARTPLIISGPAEDSTDLYAVVDRVIPQLRREQDYTIDEKARSAMLTEAGIHAVEQALRVDNLYNPDHIETLHHVSQALRAHTLYRRDVDYMVHEGKVKIIDEFTGRVLEGRRWSDGLHQAVEAKEGVRIENENQTLATITYQNYFRQYLKLGGMTGTAETEAEEFAKTYDLDVLVVPTNLPNIRADLADQVYKTEREKFDAIIEDIQARSTAGQPCLVGTVSVEKSEVLSKRLQRVRIPHNVLNAKYHEREAEIVAQAGRKSAVTIATNMAGRGTDILLGGNPEFLAARDGVVQEDPEALPKVVAQYKAQCEAEKREVLAAGGLHIVGTERHESRRIDNQLRGRSGRQGDPGSSRFYLSLEDDLMRIFGGDRLVSLMERFGMKEGEVIEHRMVTRSIENAQRKVEGHNFDIRKNLLEYDDVMNDQRKAVYKMRRRVIGADPGTTKEMLLDLVEDGVIDIVCRACPDKAHFDEWDIGALEESVRDVFDVQAELTVRDELTREHMQKRVYDVVESGAVLARERAYGPENFYGVGRVIYLQTIDRLWKEHLRDMDHLREGIGLRGYAQKDPKQEYKKEGFALFERMIATVGLDVLQKVCRVVITQETREDYQRRLQAQKEKQQRQLNMGDGTPKKPDTLRREGSKVGRNDPCPCGSGKKFKKCHGETLQASA